MTAPLDTAGLTRALIEELRPYAAKPLGSIKIDTDDIRKIVDWFDAKDSELAEARAALAETEERFRMLNMDREMQVVARLKAEAALEPFADFAQWVDAEGWTCNIHRESISTWFGPSDFRRARTVLSREASSNE